MPHHTTPHHTTPHHTNCSPELQDPYSINNFNLRYFEGSENVSFILQDFKTLFLSLEARKILRSRKWQIQTYTMAQTQTQDPPTHPPPPPTPPNSPPHTHTHTHTHVSTSICRCEDISTPYYILRSTWSTMGEQKNTTWKMQLEKCTFCTNTSDCI